MISRKKKQQRQIQQHNSSYEIAVRRGQINNFHQNSNEGFKLSTIEINY